MLKNVYLVLNVIILVCVYRIQMRDMNVLNKIEGPLPVSFAELESFSRFFISSIVTHYSSENIDLERLRNSSFYQYNNKVSRKMIKSLDIEALEGEEESIKTAILLNIRNLLMLDSLLWRHPIPKTVTDMEVHEASYSYLVQDGEILSILDLNKLIYKVFSSESKQNVEDIIPVLSMLYYPVQGLPTLQVIQADGQYFMSVEFYKSTVKMCNSRITLDNSQDISANKHETSIVVEYFFVKLKELEDWEDDEFYRWMSKCVEDIHLKTLLYYQSLKRQYLDVKLVEYNGTILSGDNASGMSRIGVDIYVQSLSPSVRTFFTEQLSPAWPQMKQFVDLNVITFGIAKVDPINNGESFEFECQNGPEECDGNKLISCAVAMFPIELQISFMKCWFEFGPLGHEKSRFSSIEETGTKCCELIDVPVSHLKRCSSSVEGDKIVYENGLKTFNLRPKLDRVPTIQINNATNTYSTEEELRSDLQNSICDAYLSKEKFNDHIYTPAGCKTLVEISFVENDTNSRDFFIDQLQPTWKRLSNIMNLKLSPNCSEGIEQTSWLEFKSCLNRSKLGLKETEIIPMGTNTIKINGVQNDQLSREANTDLATLVCNSFTKPAQDQALTPEGCLVLVSVYMESLCPDTHRFFIKHLLPAWKTISHLMDLTIIPFGKANVWWDEETDTYNFECQHGPMECLGNIAMSCVVGYLPKEEQVRFLVCMMQDHSPSFAAKRCAKRLHVNYDILRNCTSSKKGQLLLYENGMQTMQLQPALSYVPTVTINGFYDKQQLQTTLRSFKSQICKIYQGQRSNGQILTPNGCRAVINIYFELPSTQTTELFLEDIPPFMKMLEDYVDIHLFAVSTRNKTATAHGEKEMTVTSEACDDQIIAACSLSHIDEQLHLEFVKCFVLGSNISPCVRGKDCSIKLQIPWEPIHKCTQTSRAAEILAQNTNIFSTNSKLVGELPTATINGIEIKKGNLYHQVCDAFFDPRDPQKKWKPYGCPVTVDVYIEALCPAAKRFYLRELMPAWNQIGSIMQLNIIPFGKSNSTVVSGAKHFTCPNGRDECEANKILSCAATLLRAGNRIAFIGCLFQKKFQQHGISKCVKNSETDWKMIADCVQQNGDDLLFENGLITESLRPRLFYVPTVTINKIYNKEKLRSSLIDLKGSICEAYLETREGQHTDIPDGCKVQIYVLFDSFNHKMKTLFTFVLERSWFRFYKIARMTFVPLIGFQELQKRNVTSQSCLQNTHLCHKSLLLSCIGVKYDATIQLEFLACLMTELDPLEAYSKCADSNRINMEQMETCATSKASLELIEKNAIKFSRQIRTLKQFPLVGVEKEILPLPVTLKMMEEKVCSSYRGDDPYLCPDRKK